MLQQSILTSRKAKYNDLQLTETHCYEIREIEIYY